jgi:uncharacterized membrane protein
MRNMLRTLLAVVGGAILLCSSLSAARYRVSDIGTFTSLDHISINNGGMVAGTERLPSGSYSGFTWTASAGFLLLNALPGYSQCTAMGVNDVGQVVGTSSSPSLGLRTTLWENGQPVDAGAAFVPAAINNSGQVVGDSYIWSKDTGLQTIDPHAHARAINDNGVVVGSIDYMRGFIWTASTGIEIIDVSFPGAATEATGINNRGQVILQTTTTQEGPAYLWQEGLDPVRIGGGGVNGAGDINNLGQVVGGYERAPYVWDSVNGMYILTPPPGLGSAGAGAINDSGVIAGCAYNTPDQLHLLLWTPIPEPSSLAALLAGLAGFGAAIRRRR